MSGSLFIMQLDDVSVRQGSVVVRSPSSSIHRGFDGSRFNDIKEATHTRYALEIYSRFHDLKAATQKTGNAESRAPERWIIKRICSI